MLDQSINARMNAATAPAPQSEVAGFFYIDGIPTKGLWIDLLPVRGWEDIKEALEVQFPEAEIDEILIADFENEIVKPFITTSCDAFDMDSWVSFAEGLETTHLDFEVIAAYCSNFFYPSDCNIDDIEEAYAGQYEDDEAFAYEMLQSTGDLDSIPENLRFYFDYSAFARDLMMDYFEVDGYYFRNL